MINKLKQYILKENKFLYELLVSPMSNIGGIKNYKKLFLIFYRNKKASFSNFKYAIYIDNEDPSSVIQLEKWFSQNFFKKSEVLIIFRIYSSSLDKYISFLENNDFNFYAYRVIRNFSLNNSKLKYIFYIFNSFTNPILIKNRDIKHVWIAHGESDKLASVNPMIRMYDFIFVAGQISIERLINYKIISKHDIENKIIRVGMPYLEKKNLLLKSVPQNKKTKKKILYAPTWEGVESEQQYSSLANNFGFNFFEDLKNILKSFELYFMPHPSTGIKKAEYVSYVRQFVNNKQEDFYFIQNKNSYLYSQLADTIDKKKFIDKEPNFKEFDLVITDISSIVSYLIYYKVNYLVLVRTNTTQIYENDMNKLNKFMPLLSISNNIYESDIKILEETINRELNWNLEERFKKLVSYESEFSEEQKLEFYINLMENEYE